MTIAVDMGRKATKTNKQTNKQMITFGYFVRVWSFQAIYTCSKA